MAARPSRLEADTDMLELSSSDDESEVPSAPAQRGPDVIRRGSAMKSVIRTDSVTEWRQLLAQDSASLPRPESPLLSDDAMNDAEADPSAFLNSDIFLRDILSPRQLNISFEFPELCFPSEVIQSSQHTQNPEYYSLYIEIGVQARTLKQPEWHRAPLSAAHGHQLPFKVRQETTQWKMDPTVPPLVHLVPPFPLDHPLRFDSNLNVSRTNPLIGLRLTVEISRPTQQVDPRWASILTVEFPLAVDGRLLAQAETASPPTSDGSFVAIGWRISRTSLIEGKGESSHSGGKNGGGEQVSRMGRARMEAVLEAALMDAEAEFKLEMMRRVLNLTTLDQRLGEMSERPPGRQSFRPAPGTNVPSPPRPSESIALNRRGRRVVASAEETVIQLPLPKYDYITFHNAATPMDDAFEALRLDSLPTLGVMDHEIRSPEQEAEVMNHLLGTAMPQILAGVRADEEEEAVDDDVAEVNRLWHHSLTYGPGLMPDDWGRITRDFIALKGFIGALNIPPSLLAGRGDSVWGAKFLAEATIGVGPLLSRAFDVFERRTGREPYSVQRAHSAYSEEQIFSNPDPIDTCMLCGCHGCLIHLPFQSADNVPIEGTFRAWSEKQGKPVRSTKQRATKIDDDCAQICFKGPVVEWMSDRSEELQRWNSKFMHPCQISYMMEVPCVQIKQKLADLPSHNVLPPLPKLTETPIKAPSRPSKGYPPGDTIGTENCSCEGNCSASQDCACVRANAYCDHYCGCSGDCPRRFRGCGCSKKGRCMQKDGDGDYTCLCRMVSRECDPHLCACDHAECSNAQITNGQVKATLVAESEVKAAGLGLIVLEDVGPGDFIGLYAGELFETDEVVSRRRETLSALNKSSYLFGLDYRDLVDSQLWGNNMRFINDSEEPNCESKIMYVGGSHQIAVYATRALKPDDELFMDYNDSYPRPWLTEEEQEQRRKRGEQRRKKEAAEKKKRARKPR